MIPVTQDKFGERGNCLAASIASILELPLRDVPNFQDANFNDDGTQNGKWYGAVMEFLIPRGYQLIYRYDGTLIEEALPYHIISGKGPRGYWHATVGYRGEIFHDPHPSRDGLVPGEWDFGFLIPIEVKPWPPSTRLTKEVRKREVHGRSTFPLL